MLQFMDDLERVFQPDDFFFVVLNLGRHDLDNHMPLFGRVVGFPHLAHATTAEPLLDAIIAQRLSSFQAYMRPCNRQLLAHRIHWRADLRISRVSGSFWRCPFRLLPLDFLQQPVVSRLIDLAGNQTCQQSLAHLMV